MIKKQILILGYGFITSHFIHYSKNKYDFYVFDRNAIKSNHILKTFKKDFIDYKSIEKELLRNIDVVIFALSPQRSENNPALDYEKKFNLVFKEFLKSCKEYNVKKIILLSSAAVYGTKPNQSLFHEDSQLSYSNPYSIEKINLEKIISTELLNSQQSLKIMRISNPYGPDFSLKKPKTFINILIDKFEKNKTLQVDNDGKTVRDFIFISDISKGIELILNYDGDKEIFNISSGKGTKLESVINIFKQLGISPAINLLPVKQKDESILSNQLSKDILKLTEIINIEEGAKMYYKYLKKENII